MALEYSSTSAPNTDTSLKILVYGPAGVGKTVLFRTLPGKKVLLSAERGELSLAPANQIRLFGNVEDITIIRIKSAADLKEAHALISGPDGNSLQAVGLDSISEIAEKVLADEMGKCTDPRKAYGNMQDTMAKYIRLFRDLPGKSVYMTAKQDRESDGTGAILYSPSMPGKTMTQAVAHYFDLVCALFITPKDANGNTYRVLRTRADHQFSAKDRSGALAELEAPDLGAIVRKIHNTQ